MSTTIARAGRNIPGQGLAHEEIKPGSGRDTPAHCRGRCVGVATSRHRRDRAIGADGSRGADARRLLPSLCQQGSVRRGGLRVGAASLKPGDAGPRGPSIGCQGRWRSGLRVPLDRASGRRGIRMRARSFRQRARSHRHRNPRRGNKRLSGDGCDHRRAPAGRPGRAPAGTGRRDRVRIGRGVDDGAGRQRSITVRGGLRGAHDFIAGALRNLVTDQPCLAGAGRNRRSESSSRKRNTPSTL